MFEGLNPPYGAILADPPWFFRTWGARPYWDTKQERIKNSRAVERHYPTMKIEEIKALPVATLAAEDACLFLWVSWPNLPVAMELIEAWGFTYKTCAFDWMKANGSQIDLFRDEIPADMKLGYWTRSNSEPCLLATRGSPKRLSADVRMGIIEPAREHSRKPDCVHERIERLVAGPYLELFARRKRPNWDAWGNEVGKFKP